MSDIKPTPYSWRDPKTIPTRAEEIRNLNKRIEAQAAEIEKFSGIAKLAILKAYDTDKFSTDRIEAQAAEIKRLREALRDVLVYAPDYMHGMPKKYYEKISAGKSDD